MAKLYTAEELRKFDRITAKLHSPDQMTRIQGRIDVNEFVAEHGKEKCDQMFEVLKRRKRANR